MVTVFWGVMTGAVAAILLVAGGLDALQTLCILAAFPFLFIMVGVAVSLVKELRKEPGLGSETSSPPVGAAVAARPPQDANGVSEVVSVVPERA